MSWWWCCNGVGPCAIGSDDFSQGAGNPHGWDVISGTWDIVGTPSFLQNTVDGIILAPSPFVWPGTFDRESFTTFQVSDEATIVRLILESNATATSYIAAEIDTSHTCPYMRIIDQAGVLAERPYGSNPYTVAGPNNVTTDLVVQRVGGDVILIVTNSKGLPTEENHHLSVAAATVAGRDRTGLEVFDNPAGSVDFFEFGMQRISGDEPCNPVSVTECLSYFYASTLQDPFQCWMTPTVGGWAGGESTADGNVTLFDETLPNQDYSVSCEFSFNGSGRGCHRTIVDYQDPDNYHCFEVDTTAIIPRVRRIIERKAGVETVLASNSVFGSPLNAEVTVCESSGTITAELVPGLFNIAAPNLIGTKKVGIGTGVQSVAAAPFGVTANTLRIQTCDC